MAGLIQSTNLKRTMLLFCVISFVLFFSVDANAANLYLDPAEGDHQPGDTFSVNIRIDNDNDCINAAKVDLSFTKSTVNAVDFSKGDSIFTLWVEEPAIDQEEGLVSFAGGIPGGYCGRIPGDPGLSNVLGTVIFRIPGFTIGSTQDDQVSIKILETSRVLINDGFGTEATLSFSPTARFNILGKTGNAQNEWLDKLQSDNIPPEPFVVSINQDVSLFGGDYFIIFSTTDKQTGLDHFKVLESRNDVFLSETTKNSVGIVARSPYRLDDQTLQSVITVTAYDKAGNTRVVRFKPQVDHTAVGARHMLNPFSLIIIVGVIVIFIFIGILMFGNNKGRDEQNT